MVAASRLSKVVLFAAVACLPLSRAVHIGDPHSVGEHSIDDLQTNAHHRNEEQHSVEVKHAKDDESESHKDNDEATGHVELSTSEKKETRKHLSVSSLTKEQKKQAKDDENENHMDKIQKPKTRKHLSVSSLTKQEKKQAKDDEKEKRKDKIQKPKNTDDNNAKDTKQDTKKQAKDKKKEHEKDTEKLHKEHKYKKMFKSPSEFEKSIDDMKFISGSLKDAAKSAAGNLPKGVPVCIAVTDVTSSSTASALGAVFDEGECDAGMDNTALNDNEFKVPSLPFGLGGGTMKVSVKSGGGGGSSGGGGGN